MGPKKQKQTMSLGNFLSDQTLGSWADEMEDMPVPNSRHGFGGGDRGGERRGFGASSGFGGDRGGFSERNYLPREEVPLPTQPPYTAHLGNLSFDVSQGDIEDFFGEASKTTNVRLVEDKIDRKPKGFGYVEFETLEGLKNALTLNGTSFQGRNIKISVAEPPRDRPPTRELNDWTRKGPLPDLPQNNRKSSTGPPRDFGGPPGDLATEGRSTSRRGGTPYDGDKAPRDFGNWERRGPLSPAAAAPQQQGPPRDRTRPRAAEPSFERRPSPSWGEGTSRDGSRPPRPVPERTPTAAEMDNQWRSRMRPDPPTPTTPTLDTASSVPGSPAATKPAPAPAPSAPTIRPKLNLQKRTVSSAQEGGDAPASASEAKASPFGAARPIDTATRDAEIMRKREEAREAKEAEDKAKAEKAAAEGTQAPPQGRKANNRNSMPPTPTRTTSEQNGQGRPPRHARQNSTRAGPAAAENEGGETDNRDSRFSILQREEQGDGTVDASANGEIVDDKSVKPKEVVRPIGQGDGEKTADTNEELAGEGWETAKPKGGRHRRGPSQGAGRALAS